MNEGVIRETLNTILHEQLGLALAREHTASLGIQRVHEAESSGYLTPIEHRRASAELVNMLRDEERDAHRQVELTRAMLADLDAILNPPPVQEARV